MNQTTSSPIKPETFALIERLIGFDTTSRGSNLGLIEWARDYLKGYGIESRLTYDATGKKANLFATVQKPGFSLTFCAMFPPCMISFAFTGIETSVSASFRRIWVSFWLANFVKPPDSRIASMTVIPSRYSMAFGALTAPRT